MRKLLTFLLMLTALSSQASPIDKQQARQVAAQFAASQGHRLSAEPLRAPRTSSATESEPLYVFNTQGDQGFIIIAGDDRVDAVIGYTTEGRYDEANLPDNFRNWLISKSEEIAALPEQTAADPSPSPRRVSSHAAIAPLIKTTWNQGKATARGYIYNTTTPTINGLHCLTGCVATAGAQLMYYYRWPEKATKAVPGYESNDDLGTLPNKPATTFKWDQMKEKYTSADTLTQAEAAVSNLMLYCGYAAQMDYGLGMSGANNPTLARGMANYFDYDPYTWKYVVREAYTVEGWDNLIYNELRARRPVLYSGSAYPKGGHSFICDGYDGNGFYHFNWGWGGNHNGYFKLHITDPYQGGNAGSSADTYNTGYVVGETAVIGVQPNTGQGPQDNPDDNDTWDVPTSTDIVATASNVSIEGTTITMRLSNNTSVSQHFGFGFGEVNGDGTITMVDTSRENLKGTELQSGYGFPKVTFNVANFNLSVGTHHLVPMSILASETTWRQCNPLLLWFEVTVAQDGAITIVQHPIIDIRLENIVCTSSHLPQNRQVLSFDVVNYGENNDGRLYLFASTTTDKGDYQDYEVVKIKAGGTKHRTMGFYTETTGTYNVWITTDYSGENVVAQTKVVVEKGVTASSISVEGTRFAKAMLKLKTTVSSKYECKSPLYLFASTSNAKGSPVYCVPTAIEAGGTEDVLFRYKPLTAGSWYFWIATDEGANNVIAQTAVTINNAPTGEVNLSKVSMAVTTKARPDDTTAHVDLKVKNSGSVVFYENLRFYLYYSNGNVYPWMDEYFTEEHTLNPNATWQTSADFSGLQPDFDYLVVVHYRKSFGSTSWKELARQYFTTGSVPTAIQQVNAEGDDHYYTLDGMRLKERPATPGIYIRNGKKVVVK